MTEAARKHLKARIAESIESYQDREVLPDGSVIVLDYLRFVPLDLPPYRHGLSTGVVFARGDKGSEAEARNSIAEYLTACYEWLTTPVGRRSKTRLLIPAVHATLRRGARVIQMAQDPRGRDPVPPLPNLTLPQQWREPLKEKATRPPKGRPSAKRTRAKTKTAQPAKKGTTRSSRAGKKPARSRPAR